VDSRADEAAVLGEAAAGVSFGVISSSSARATAAAQEAAQETTTDVRGEFCFALILHFSFRLVL
jgi:hypothetical protein